MLLSSFLLFIYCFFQWIQINRNAMALFTASTRVRNCYRLLLLRFVFAQCALHRLRFTLDWDIYFLNLNLLEWTEQTTKCSKRCGSPNQRHDTQHLLTGTGTAEWEGKKTVKNTNSVEPFRIDGFYTNSTYGTVISGAQHEEFRAVQIRAPLPVLQYSF